MSNSVRLRLEGRLHKKLSEFCKAVGRPRHEVLKHLVDIGIEVYIERALALREKMENEPTQHDTTSGVTGRDTEESQAVLNTNSDTLSNSEEVRTV